MSTERFKPGDVFQKGRTRYILKRKCPLDAASGDWEVRMERQTLWGDWEWYTFREYARPHVLIHDGYKIVVRKEQE